MKQRGRKGVAALTAPAGAVVLVERPDAPLDLTEAQSDVWRETVEAMPADWFPRETWPLLSQWCRHTVEARRIAQLIDNEIAADDLNLAAYAELLKMQRQETAALKTLAAAMRLAQQSSYSARGAGGQKDRREPGSRRPWEV